MNPFESEASPLEMLASRFRTVTDDGWRVASEWMELLDLPFHERSLRRYLDQLVGPALEMEMRRSDRINNRFCAHYRPRAALRIAAQQMQRSKGDGINVV
jgi:hypothetical protein